MKEDKEKEEVNKIFNKNKLLAELDANNDNLLASLDSMILNYKLIAKLQRAKFEALRKEGFTMSQSLELCKVIF